MLIVKSLLYFLLAGLCEIGGGYLMWLWLREGRSLLFGLSGAAILKDTAFLAGRGGDRTFVLWQNCGRYARQKPLPRKRTAP